MGSKGINNKSFTLWEELELRVSTDSGKVAIYKKTYNDTREGREPLPIEDRSYFVHIPVPNTKGGIRKSLLTKDRTTAITKVNEMVVNVMVGNVNVMMILVAVITLNVMNDLDLFLDQMYL